MHGQMASVLVLMRSYDVQIEYRGENRGSVSQYVHDLQLILAKSDKQGYRCVMENFEQDLEDMRMQSKEDSYQPKDLNTAIRLTKKSDLKNRTLVKQLKDLCSCKQLLNHVAKNSPDIDIVPLDARFISYLRKSFTPYLRDTYVILTGYLRDHKFENSFKNMACTRDLL